MQVQIPLPRKGTETKSPNPKFIKTPACSNSITPQGDGNSETHSTYLVNQDVQIPLPRKGTETSSSQVKNYIIPSVQIPLPRKGTETITAEEFLENRVILVQIPLPRKGTETIPVLITDHEDKVQIPLPRKGTETYTAAPQSLQMSMFKFHYPARGRKPDDATCLCNESFWFKFHYPARGRKLKRGQKAECGRMSLKPCSN